MASLTMTFTVPNAQAAQNILDAFCAVRGYDAASGISKQEFVRSEVRDFLYQAVYQYYQQNRNTELQINLRADMATVSLT